MDSLTQKLMLDLEGNGLRPVASLVRDYDVGELTIRRRIHYMTSNNLIKMMVVPNFLMLGLKAWARIGIKVRLGYLERVTQNLIANPNIYFVTYTAGRFDIIISLHSRTIEELAHFVNSELAKDEGIAYTETILLVAPRRYNLFSWPAPDFNSARGPAPRANYEYELDATDQNILDVLQKEGPARPKILASKLGMSEHSVRRRLKTLWSNGLYRIEVLPMVPASEYTTQATIGINTFTQSPEKVMNALLEYKEIYLAAYSAGRYNFLIAARFPNPEILNRFITKELPSVPGINFIETYLHIKRLKYYNLTWPVS